MIVDKFKIITKINDEKQLDDIETTLNRFVRNKMSENRNFYIKDIKYTISHIGNENTIHSVLIHYRENY